MIAYVDITFDGISVSIPRDDTAELERILQAGIARAPLAATTEPHFDGTYLSAAITLDGELDVETLLIAEDMRTYAEDALYEGGFRV
jgi:hypothetical protein